MPDFQSLRIRYLETLANYQRRDDGNAPYLPELFGEEFTQQDRILWDDVMASLEEDGLINVNRGLGGPGSASGDLTSRGRNYLRDIEAARKDPAQRKLAAANGLLRWLYARDPYGLDYQRVSEAEGAISLEGAVLPLELLMSAADRLGKFGLAHTAAPITEMRGLPLLAKLSDVGQELVETGRNVEDFMSEKRQAAGNTFNIGTMSGNMAVDANDFTQTSTTYTGSPSEDLKILIQAIGESLPAFGLADDQVVDVEKDLQAISAEAGRSNSDQRFVRDRLMTVLDTVIGAGKPAVGLVLMGMAKKWAHDIGLPVDSVS